MFANYKVSYSNYKY